MTDENELVQKSARFVPWILVALVVVVADQTTKWAINEWVRLYDVVPINSFIDLTHQRNTGAAWSFLADAGGWQRWFFVVLSSIVSVAIAVWLWRIRHTGPAILAAGLSLVLGGAIGNLIDRIRLGYVIDFIRVYLGEFLGYFPSFNIADTAISIGAALLIIDALFFSGRQESPTA